MGKGSFCQAHCLCVHLPSPFAVSFKVSLKCVQSFRRGIQLNLLTELRKAEAAAKLKIWKGEKLSVWVRGKPCCKGTEVWWEAEHVFFLTVCCNSCGGWQWASPSLPPRGRASPLDHASRRHWGHSSSRRRKFSASHGKCSPLRSPWLGGQEALASKYPWRARVVFPIRCQWHLTIVSVHKKETVFSKKCFSKIFFKPLPTSFAQVNLVIQQCERDELCLCPTCSTLTALASPPWPYGLRFWTVTCSRFHNGS